MLRVSGKAVRKEAVAGVCEQEGGLLEKLEGPWSQSQIPLLVLKLCGVGLGAKNRMESRQCLHRQMSESF